MRRIIAATTLVAVSMAGALALSSAGAQVPPTTPDPTTTTTEPTATTTPPTEPPAEPPTEPPAPTSPNFPGYVVKPLGGEVEVDLGSVPAAVLHAAMVAVPDADWTSASIDNDDVDAVYELVGTSAHFGTEIEVDVFADGVVAEIELGIDPSMVTEAAGALFAEQFPGFSTEALELSLRPTRSGVLEVFFEWAGTTEDGAAVDVEIDGAGSQYLVEVETTDE